jgi:hypothetical protein
MEVKNEISQELISLSAVVAAIGRQTPYEVPEGYFSAFPALTLRRISEWNMAKSLKFNVPEGYFEGFAKGVLDRIKAGDIPNALLTPGVDEELAAISPMLAAAGRITPYEEPEGYFQELSPILSLLKDKNPYTVPQGYFEVLTAETIARTAEPVSLDPAGSMEGSTMAGGSVTPVISISGRTNRKMSWWKYAAAAVVTGLILTAGWLRFHSPGTHGSKEGADIAGSLATVSDQDLRSFLTDHSTQPLSQSSTTTAQADDNDPKALLGNVPDVELKQYLEEHGGADGIATN